MSRPQRDPRDKYRTRLIVVQLEERTVPGYSPTVDLSAAQDSPLVDEPDTFTATVQEIDGEKPTGTVDFYENGTTLLGSGTLDGSGVATFTTSFPSTTGFSSITADYLGDSNFNSGNSSSQNISVQMAPTTTVLTSSTSTSTYGQSVTFTATVSTSDTDAGTPTGTVMFGDRRDRARKRDPR